jgi:hypothetical protein
MREDAQDVSRREVFHAALIMSHDGGLDEYINFLSANLGLFEFTPTKRSTANFKL